MSTLGKAICTTHVENKNRKHFLRQYRATPHITTNISPPEALNMQSAVEDPLQSFSESLRQDTRDSLRKRDQDRKLR